MSFVNKKIHLTIGGKRTTININVYLAVLYLRKHTGEQVDSFTISDTNISDIRKLIQAEIDQKMKNPLTSPFKKDRLKERVEEYLIHEIADPKLLPLKA